MWLEANQEHGKNISRRSNSFYAGIDFVLSTTALSPDL